MPWDWTETALEGHGIPGLEAYLQRGGGNRALSLEERNAFVETYRPTILPIFEAAEVQAEIRKRIESKSDTLHGRVGDQVAQLLAATVP
eukprot:5214439-Alexandrium_andersonii.AAC.1